MADPAMQTKDLLTVSEANKLHPVHQKKGSHYISLVKIIKPLLKVSYPLKDLDQVLG